MPEGIHSPDTPAKLPGEHSMEASVPEGSRPGLDPQQHLRLTTGLTGRYSRADLRSPHVASSGPGQLRSALTAGASPGAQSRAQAREGGLMF